jgi:hypothetical protein
LPALAAATVPHRLLRAALLLLLLLLLPVLLP